jgi:hypothetical protein
MYLIQRILYCVGFVFTCPWLFLDFSRSCSRVQTKKVSPATMSVEALERAIADMNANRKAFEAAAVRVSRELEALAERVSEANGKLSTEREHIARAVGKRRRRSGGGAGVGRAAGAGAQAGADDDVDPNADIDTRTERRFKDTVEDVEEHLQTATRAMARVHAATQSVRASVDAAKADAIALLSADRMAAAKESRNEGCNELIRLMGRVDLGSSNHEMILRHLGVVSLWRVRGVSRGFRRWATSMLSCLPRVVAVGGFLRDSSVAPPKDVTTASVESLDLSTMRWSAAGCMLKASDFAVDEAVWVKLGSYPWWPARVAADKNGKLCVHPPRPPPLSLSPAARARCRTQAQGQEGARGFLRGRH